MKNSTLQPDDMKIGQHITAIKGVVYPEREISTLMGETKLFSGGEDHSFQGDVMQITAIDLPFIVVKHCKGSLSGIATSFDLRRGWQFKLLSPEYIKAMTNP